MLFDAIPKLLRLDFAVDGAVDFGYADGSVLWIGLTLLVCTVLYAMPCTPMFGAILLTGYLGGATAIQVRLEAPWFLFPCALGMLAMDVFVSAR